MKPLGRPWLDSQVSGTLSATKNDSAVRRRRALERVDRELSQRKFKAAVSLVKQLQRRPGHGLRFFGAAKQVPKTRMSVIEDLELKGIGFRNFESLLGSVMDSIQRCREFALLDQDLNKGFNSLTYEEGNQSSCEDDHFMCAQHEAGHFLVGYLIGVLPKGYYVPSVEAFRHDQFAVGRVDFLGFEFLREVGVAKMKREGTQNNELPNQISKGKVSSKTLNNFLSVILGGLVAEYMRFGFSEGLHSDIEKLDQVLSWLDYTESEAESQVRWAAANCIYVLYNHDEARSRLAEDMALGRTVGCCINTIEDALSQELSNHYQTSVYKTTTVSSVKNNE